MTPELYQGHRGTQEEDAPRPLRAVLRGAMKAVVQGVLRIFGLELRRYERDKGPPVLMPLGHYYSPMYDARELATRRGELWVTPPRATPDVVWRDEAQLALCVEVFCRQEPLALERRPSLDETEYWSDNPMYSPLDAWVLAAMLRHLRPSRMIEIGSGFSSLVTARVNREELDGRLYFTCIEPNPRDFLVAGVEGISDLRIEQVQTTPLELFTSLGENDVLFVDTSHTVKTGGDVTWIYHEIVPRLAPGVVIHLHDIFLPGEYPEWWVMEGRGWNETYLVRSFLSYNSAFEVLWGTQYMLQHHPDTVLQAFPALHAYQDLSGGSTSLWLRRVR